MQVGDRVKDKASGTLGTINRINEGGAWVSYDHGSIVWTPLQYLAPINVTVLEGDVFTESYTDGSYRAFIDNADVVDVNEWLARYSGKRVRITIEVLDEEEAAGDG